MKTAIIGYTGFVGGYLDSNKKFSDRFNSKNIQEIGGNSYECIVCAGAPGVKWFANEFPEQDKDNINRLIANLERARTERFVLISTIDVYPHPTQVDESSRIEFEKLTPYSANRRRLEQFIESNFSNSNIIRLPGLFGRGLKKNIIFDLITKTNLDKLPASGQFQFYDLADLPEDMDLILNQGIGLINLVTEPLTVQEIYQEIFQVSGIGNTTAPSPNYDVRTRYFNLFGGINYILGKEQVKEKLKSFLQEEGLR
jgi:nucleoside-diphosphate-sugar epimerase